MCCRDAQQHRDGHPSRLVSSRGTNAAHRPKSSFPTLELIGQVAHQPGPPCPCSGENEQLTGGHTAIWSWGIFPVRRQESHHLGARWRLLAGLCKLELGAWWPQSLPATLPHSPETPKDSGFSASCSGNSSRTAAFSTVHDQS